MKIKIYVFFITIFLFNSCSSTKNEGENIKNEVETQESGVMHVLPDESVSNNSF